jgi:hypothetical protein
MPTSVQRMVPNANAAAAPSYMHQYTARSPPCFQKSLQVGRLLLLLLLVLLAWLQVLAPVVPVLLQEAQPARSLHVMCEECKQLRHVHHRCRQML